jgi:hypothetical protein
MDFTKRAIREANGSLRDIARERAVELEVTKVLRENFSFRFIEILSQEDRMGQQGLERAPIGTLASCPDCRPTADWLGSFHPNEKIRNSGLWLIHHLSSAPLSAKQRDLIGAAISSV